MKKLFSIMWCLQIHYHFKLDFQKVDQHTGGTWLIHGTKHHKDNQFQSLELLCIVWDMKLKLHRSLSDYMR